MRAVLLLMLLIPLGSAVGQEFQIYVSDAGNFDSPPWQILRFDEQGGNPEVFITQNLAWPQDILFLEESGTVLISNLNSGRIDRYDATTGDFIDIFAGNISGPTRMKFGPDGLLYVLQWQGNGRVRRYQADGTYLGEFTDRGVSQSIGLDWDGEGRLYVSSYGGDHVRRFAVDGHDDGLFISSNLVGPTNIWFDGSGDLLVSDYDGGAIRRFGPDGAYKGVFIGGLSNPEGVAYLQDGSLLLGNGGTGAVKRYTPAGSFVGDFVASGAGGLLRPNAVVVRGLSDAFEINAGMADAWYDPATAGQGFLITVFTGLQQLFLAWFTYDVERPPGGDSATLGDSGHRWLTAQGPYSGSRAELTLYLTAGGVFDSAEPPASTDPAAYGTLELDFADCSSAVARYEIPALGLAGEIPLQRIVEDRVALCEALASP